LKLPAFSPDMNTIELVWHELKSYIRKKTCLNLDSLIYRIQKFFHYKLTAEKCLNYINRIEKVCDIIIERRGDWSDC
jgi:transposase